MKKIGIWLMCAMSLGMASCLTTKNVKDTPEAAAIPDADYIQVSKDGHLELNGKRKRFWSVIGKPFIGAGVKKGDSPEVIKEKVAKAWKSTDALLDRFEDLGFNSVRLWNGFKTKQDYTIGDGSTADSVDYFLDQAYKRGFRVWTAGLNQVCGPLPEDVNIIDDPATAKEWLKAIDELPKKKTKNSAAQRAGGLRNNMARIWDPRLEAIAIRSMETIATHYNKYRKLRWCDDPVFGVWELSNEEWWVRRMISGRWKKLPEFFRESLVQQWNDFLIKKYQDDTGLKKAWNKLLPGESLKKKTVIFAPMAGKSKASVGMNDANLYAAEAMEVLEQEYSRSDFAKQRCSDVLEFLMGLIIKHKQKEAAAIKKLGKSTRLCPMIFDTGTGYDIHSQYLQQHADAVAYDAYTNGYGPDYKEWLKKADDGPTVQQKLRMTIEAERICSNEGPWINWLLKPPGLHQGVPWLEQNKIEGKPYFCYETQIQQPAKYRADYPLRLVTLASIQDWDWICWHYFASGNDVGHVDKPFEKPMDVTTGRHPQGYHFTYDAVQSATMRSAAEIFTKGLVAKAPTPTQFIWGRKSLYEPDSMYYAGSYGMSGLDMNQTVYQYGVRIKTDPTMEEDKVIGPVVKVTARHTHNPYTPTDEIKFDWKKGYLKLDAPNAVAFTGMIAKVGKKISFSNGVILEDVKVHVPKGMPYSDGLAENKFIAFAYTGELDKKATISLVCSSFNTDYKLTKVEGNRARGKRGKLPVITARVSGTVKSPKLNGMKYTFRDWHMNDIGSGTIKDGKLVIPADKPIFITELTK